jgi:hypothetical protein
MTSPTPFRNGNGRREPGRLGAHGDHHGHDHGAHDHDHDHGPHDHGHDHPHVHENYAARSHPEFVVLDLGDGVGALIVHADAAMHGVEVEISPTGHDERRQHKEVLERRAGDRAAFTAVFDALDAGSYTLWVDDVARARDVTIGDGAIAELDWTGQGREPSPAA